MDSEFILMNELNSNLIVMNENMYDYIVNNIAINNFLILFTLGCTLGLICCNKKDDIDNKYIVVSSNNNVKAVKGEIINNNV